MVIAESDSVELRYLIVFQKSKKVFFPYVESACVPDRQIVAGITRTSMTFQNGYGWLSVGYKFSVRTIRDSVPVTIIPDKTIFVICNLSFSFYSIGAAAYTITSRPCFFNLISLIGAHTTIIAVSANFSFHIKVI